LRIARRSVTLVYNFEEHSFHRIRRRAVNKVLVVFVVVATVPKFIYRTVPTRLVKDLTDVRERMDWDAECYLSNPELAPERRRAFRNARRWLCEADRHFSTGALHEAGRCMSRANALLVQGGWSQANWGPDWV
jgi:hypothetical protein